MLLLDEPLSALDAKLREAMQLELVNLQKSVGITFVMVTHSQSEALSVADRIAVMKDGRVEQIAGPMELYDKPSSRFCADFIGKLNPLQAQIVDWKEGRLMAVIHGVGPVRIPREVRPAGNVTLAIRPERLQLSVDEPADTDCIRILCKVSQVVYFGSTSQIFLTNSEGLQLMADIRNREGHTARSFEIGSSMWVSWQAADTLVLSD